MCGIAGIVNLAGLPPDASLRVQAMCASLAPPQDPAAFADAVETIRRRDRDRLRAAARQRAVGVFSWEVTFRRTFELYDRLLAARRQALGRDESPLPDRLHS